MQGRDPGVQGRDPPGPKMLWTWAISSATEGDENKIEAGLERHFSRETL